MRRTSAKDARKNRQRRQGGLLTEAMWKLCAVMPDRRL
jgi:hypothetical protein